MGVEPGAAAQFAKESSLAHAARGPRQLLAPLAGGLLAFALYTATLPPGLTWAHNGADGGDLLAAALTQGVPHPTGYPTYQLLLRLALVLFDGGPARSGASLSAICAASAVALLIDLAQRAVRHGHEGHRAAASWASLVAGLAWAASAGLWSQAVIVEVYPLNGLVCVGLLWLAWRWSEAAAGGGKSWPWLTAAGLLFGLGLGNHLTVVLMLPGLGAWLWLNARERPGKVRLAHDFALASPGFMAGLLVYLYLPLAASGRPQVNWGGASTLEGFLWVVTGRPYAGLAFGLPVSELPARLLGWATETARQFRPWGLVLAFAGLWRLDRVSRPWWTATLLIWLAFTIYAIGYNTTDSLTYLIPAFAVMGLWMAEALFAAFAWAGRRPPAQMGLAALAFAILPLASAVLGWQEQDLSSEREAEHFLSSALTEAEPSAVILTAGDERTFALWYGVYGLRRRPDVALLNVNLYPYEWYRRTLAETHPNLLPSDGRAPPVESLVADLLARHPVYAAEDLGLELPQVDEQRGNVLTRMRSLEQPE